MLSECIVRHDGKYWVAEIGADTISAEELEELDRKIELHLRRNGALKEGERAEVFMAFDNSTIPQWIRQYAQHYFNRVIEVKG